MERLSHPTETVLSNKIIREIIVLSFKDSPRKPLGRRPIDDDKCSGVLMRRVSGNLSCGVEGSHVVYCEHMGSVVTL